MICYLYGDRSCIGQAWPGRGCAAMSYISLLGYGILHQRVLNDLYGHRLSRRLMILLLPRPLHLSSQQVVSLSQSS
jgi:hypothetical protein